MINLQDIISTDFNEHVFKQKSDILSIVITHNRNHLIPRLISSVKKQSLLTDICVWDNNYKGKHPIIDDDILLFKGINILGNWQRFLPAMVCPHKYVMFIDDDIEIGRLFLEKALTILSQYSNAVVTSGGSVIDLPMNEQNIYKRHQIYGMKVKNANLWHLDLGQTGCMVCHKNHIKAVFSSGIIPPFFCDDILFFVSHSVYNDGIILLSPHEKKDEMGIVNFDNAHLSGACSRSDFVDVRNKMLFLLYEKLKWNPRAQTYPEWKHGEARQKIFK